MHGWVGRWGGKGKCPACVESRAGIRMTHGLMWEELSPPGETYCAGLPQGSRHIPVSKHPPWEVPPYRKHSRDQKFLSTPAPGSPGGLLVPAAPIPSLPCVVSHLVTL